MGYDKFFFYFSFWKVLPYVRVGLLQGCKVYTHIYTISSIRFGVWYWIQCAPLLSGNGKKSTPSTPGKNFITTAIINNNNWSIFHHWIKVTHVTFTFGNTTTNVSCVLSNCFLLLPFFFFSLLLLLSSALLRMCYHFYHYYYIIVFCNTNNEQPLNCVYIILFSKGVVKRYFYISTGGVNPIGVTFVFLFYFLFLLTKPLYSWNNKYFLLTFTILLWKS